MERKIKEIAKQTLREDDDALSDDELLAELEDDPELERLREKRLDQLKREMDWVRDLRSRGHGDYEEITKEEEMVKSIGGSNKALVHFYHSNFARCKILDSHLRTLSRHHFETRFVCINVDKCPFLVKKFQVRMLPCMLAIVKGQVAERLVGFEEFGNNDDFSTESLEKRLARTGAIQMPSAELAHIPVSQRPVLYGSPPSGSTNQHHDNQEDDEDELDY